MRTDSRSNSDSDRAARGHNRRSRRTCAERLEPRRLLSDSFQNAVIQGGGFVDGIVFSPSKLGTAYARTDTGGAYTWNNSASSWAPLTDWINNSESQYYSVLSIAVDPENGSNVYMAVGSYLTTGSLPGALMVSNNAGASWSQINLPFYLGGDAEGRETGARLVVDPNDSNVMLLGTDQNGLWEGQYASNVWNWTQLTGFSSAAGATSNVTFVTFAAPSGTTGSPTQTIYAGAATSSGANIFVSSNGGTTWAAIPNEPSASAAPAGTSGLVPIQGQLSSTGYLDVTYGNVLGPDGETNGAVWSVNTATSDWTDISPVVPGVTNGSTDTFGYGGVAIDPQNSNTIMVASMDRTALGDQIWRSTNGGSTWITVGTGSNVTRSYANAPWISLHSGTVGAGDWMASIAIDPFNVDHVIYGDSQGVWSTTDMTSADSGGNVTWSFSDSGLENSDINKLIAPPTGVPLLSAAENLDGFAYTTLTTSPAAGTFDPDQGTATSIDFAPNDSGFIAQVFTGAAGGSYSLDDGTTWTSFASVPFSGAAGGTIAVSANGGTLVWSPAGAGVYYSTNDGKSWTPSSGAFTGGAPIADRVSSGYFYIYNPASGSLYVSSNGGATFASAATGLPLTGEDLTATIGLQGDLWLPTASGLYHSTNHGSSFTKLASVQQAMQIALGKAAPGVSYPTIYLWGEVSNVLGIFMSTNEGSSWAQLNSTAQQWGTINSLAADPNVYDRVYVGTATRGILIGQPADSVPTDWTDQDIGWPGQPGFATDNSNEWTIGGGGAGIGATSDQFNFAQAPLTDQALMSAQVLGMTNTYAASQAGVMFRGGTDSGDPFVAVVLNSQNQVIFEWRTAAGGSVASATASVSGSTYYVRVVRTSTTGFTGYYSSDDTTWTQVGPTVTIPAMPTTANAGLFVTSGNNSQLTTATFADEEVTYPPTVTNAAAVSANPVTTRTVQLSALGNSSVGENNLTYTWSASVVPAHVAAPTFSADGTNAAQNTTANFYGAGSYTFVVTISDPSGLTTTSSVSTTVIRTVATVDVTPSIVQLSKGDTYQFATATFDQFGSILFPSLVTWSVIGSGSTITADGLLTFGSGLHGCVVEATSGSAVGSAQVVSAPPSQNKPTNPGGSHTVIGPSLPVLGSPTTFPIQPADTLSSITTAAGPALIDDSSDMFLLLRDS
jgi:hypothetical protein